MKTAMKGLFSLTLAAAISQPAYATIVASGNAYLPSQINISQQVSVGVYGGAGPLNGTLEVNASSIGNGFTSFTSTGLVIGEYGGNGIVRVVGNGTSGSARININPGFGLRNSLGGTGTGLLEIKNGGLIQSYEHVYLGNQGLSATPGSATTVIDGNGSILRAQQTSTGDWWDRDGGRIYVGFDGQSNSTVNITNGGLMEAVSGHVGDQGDEGSIWIGGGDFGSVANVNVSGPGSLMRASTYIEVGSRATNTVSTLNISNGARVEVADDPDYVEMNISTLAGTAAVNVTGASSILDAQHIQIGGIPSIVGFTANGTPVTSYDWSAAVVGQQVQDEQGNLIYDRNGAPVLAVNYYGSAAPSTYTAGNRIYEKATGSLVVENGARVVAKTISVSSDSRDVPTYNNQGAVLTVRNGGVVAVTENVNVLKDGTLNGNGTIMGNVVVNGGILAPGNSPGTITIDGNLELLSGVLEIEIGGAGVNEFDVVHVLGDLNAANGFDVKLKLLNNFVPQQGQTFEFLDIDGAANFDFGLVHLVLDQGVPGFNINFTGGKMSLISAAPVPVPASVWLFGSGLVGLLGLRRRTSVG